MHQKYQLAAITLEDNRFAAVSITGEVDIGCAPQLREELEALLEGDCRHLCVDIEKVKHLDSFSLGAFVGVRQRARSRGGTISLVCTNPMLLRLFSMTNLDKLFEFFQTVEQFQAEKQEALRPSKTGPNERSHAAI